MNLTTLGYAFVGGLLPSLVWLYFLLKEESRCPEPRTMVAVSFVVGMMTVLLALPIEQLACGYFSPGNSCVSHINEKTIVAWALIEETLKYLMAAAFILWRPTVRESTNYVIYLITVALGFAAAENMLFLLAPLSGGDILMSLYTGDLRFIGSNLLHVLSSSLVGFALALSDRSGPPMRIIAAAGGLILAVMLHATFNTLMITPSTSSTLVAVFLVWSGTIIFLAAFEILKYFQYRNLPPNTCP